jgi:membrane protein DedA with SNARE-associated domain
MTALIQSFGPLGVFLLMVPESACIPVPSEVTLIFSGFAVSQHWMSLALAVLAATAGNLVGSLIAYALGASGIVARVPGRRLVFGPAERLLDRRGVSAVFVARLLPLARTFVSLPAGARLLPIVPFILLTTVGCALWAVLFVVLGMVSGSAWSAVSSVVGKVLLGAGLVIVACVVLRRPRDASHDGD